MKKLLLTLLLHLSILSSSSYGNELNSLFGVNLYENAEKYFSSNFIDSNKIDRVETLGGFYLLNITNKVKNKSPYANYYYISYDILLQGSYVESFSSRFWEIREDNIVGERL